MPSAHRCYAEWTPERFQRWARTLGPNTEGLIIAILAHRPHPKQGFRNWRAIKFLLDIVRDIENRIEPETAETSFSVEDEKVIEQMKARLTGRRQDSDA